MSDGKESVPTYVGRCAKCNGIVYAHVYDDIAKADPRRRASIGREIAACVRRGVPVSLETVGAVRTGQFCECERPKQRRQKVVQTALAI